MSNVEAVIEAVQRGAAVEALTIALGDWHRSPTPCIADAVDALDDGAASSFEAPKALARAAFQAEWLELAARPSEPLATGWLARQLAKRVPEKTTYFGLLDERYVYKKYYGMFARLNALQKRPPDPRVARALTELVVRAPYSVWNGPAASALYGRILEALVAQRDGRSAIVLCDLLKAPRARSATVREYLQAKLPEVIEQLNDTTLQDGPDAERWRSLLPKLRPKPISDEATDTEQSLLNAVCTDPDDDEARLVYADLLQTRDDPRGEFIALQMLQDAEAIEAAASKIRSLQRKHKTEWLGEDLQRVLTNVVFEKGFIASASLAQNAVATAHTWQTAAQDSRLATVHTLEKGRGNAKWYGAFVSSPAMVGLKQVEIPNWTVLDQLIAGRPEGRLAHLDLHRPPSRPRIKRIVGADAFVNVVGLKVRFDRTPVLSFVDDLLASPLVERLDALAFEFYTLTAVTEAFEIWGRLPAAIDRFRHGGLQLDRTPDGIVASIDSWTLARSGDDFFALPEETSELRLSDTNIQVQAQVDRLRAARPSIRIEYDGSGQPIQGY